MATEQKSQISEEPILTKETPALSGLGVVHHIHCVLGVVLISHLTGFAVLSALITLFFIRPLSHDGMVEEDRAVNESFSIRRISVLTDWSLQFREYLEANGYDTSAMGLKPTDSDFAGSVDEKEPEVDTKIAGSVTA